MRTKSLLLAVALSAAGVATSMAQTVYSVNVVGYHSVTLFPGFNLVANQMVGNNAITNIAGVPNMKVYKFTPGTGYSIYTFDDIDLVWTGTGVNTATLNAGEGAFISNPTSTNITMTFVGEVNLDNTTNAYPSGFSIRSAKAPVAGNLPTLGFVGAPNDKVYKYKNPNDPAPGLVGYSIYTFDDIDLIWTGPANGGIPAVNVGDAFFLSSVAGGSWVKDFVP